ncbi:MAG TPA: aspartate-semialdehyde dehydrogenase [bacterium]|nr:aspartate-semialdehyde dehydrogenase [bacterium]
MSGEGFTVAVVGATGVVGSEMVRVLSQRGFPVRRLRLFATARSAGRHLPFGDHDLEIEETSAAALAGHEVVLFAGGDDASRQFAWTVADGGGVAIDNSSTWRLDPRVPLVIPEVNAHLLATHQGVIANPNCTAATIVMVLAPLHRAAGIKRAVVATYQSVSGGGADNVRALLEQTRALLDEADALQFGPLDRIERAAGTPHPLAFNVLPQWKWGPDGYTEEELKIVVETHKIMDADFPVLPTTVRVPVLVGHTVAMHLDLERPLPPEEARRILAASAGVEVVDAPEAGRFPTPVLSAGRDEVLVGRIRRDPTSATGLLLVAAGDNLRKGAALNAVQIAEALVAQRLLPRAPARA